MSSVALEAWRNKIWCVEGIGSIIHYSIFFPSTYPAENKSFLQIIFCLFYLCDDKIGLTLADNVISFQWQNTGIKDSEFIGEPRGKYVRRFSRTKTLSDYFLVMAAPDLFHMEGKFSSSKLQLKMITAQQLLALL